MEIYFFISTMILVGWCLGIVSYFFLKKEKESNRLLDCVMTLVDKEKAIVATNIGRMREAGGKRVREESEEEVAKRLRNKLMNDAWDSMNKTGIATQEDLERLEGR